MDEDVAWDYESESEEQPTPILDEDSTVETRLYAFISKADAVASGYFTQDEADRLAQIVHSGLEIIRIDANQTLPGGAVPLAHLIRQALRGQGRSKLRKSLRTPQDGLYTYQPFNNGMGRLMQFVIGHRKGTAWYKPHFRFDSDRGKSSSKAASGFPSPEHEEAIRNAMRAASANKLRAYSVCSCNSHEAIATNQSWVHLAIAPTAVNPITINGSGDNRRVVKDYKWNPLGAIRPFVLDAAVVRRDADGNDHLEVAIEIQNRHPNSNRKRNAFERFGIVHVQISSTEINRIFRDGIGLHGPVDRDVIVQHHPISRKHTWMCAPCELKEEERIRQQDIQNKLYQERNRVRNAYHKQVITNFDRFKGGHYVRAFLCEHPKRWDNYRGSFRVKLYESMLDTKDLTGTRFITIVVPGDEINRWIDLYTSLKNSDSKLVTLHLPVCMNEDQRRRRSLQSSQLPSLPVQGVDAPGFEEWNRKRLQIQSSLLEDPSRVIIRKLKSCGRCISDEWCPPPGSTAVFKPYNTELRNSSDGRVEIYDSSGAFMKDVSASQYRDTTKYGRIVLYNVVRCMGKCTLCGIMLKKSEKFRLDAQAYEASEQERVRRVETEREDVEALRASFTPRLYLSDAELKRIRAEEEKAAEAERIRREQERLAAEEKQRLEREEEIKEQMRVLELERLEREALRAEQEKIEREKQLQDERRREEQRRVEAANAAAYYAQQEEERRLDEEMKREDELIAAEKQRVWQEQQNKRLEESVATKNEMIRKQDEQKIRMIAAEYEAMKQHMDQVKEVMTRLDAQKSDLKRRRPETRIEHLATDESLRHACKYARRHLWKMELEGMEDTQKINQRKKEMSRHDRFYHVAPCFEES